MNASQTISHGMSHLRDAINLVKPFRMNVWAEKGVIVLSGVVDSHVKKITIEKAAGRVLGVRCIVSKINVTITRPKVKNLTK